MALDAVQQLVFDADKGTACVVLGKGEDEEITLVWLDEPGPVPQAVLADANARGLKLCGVLALVRGQAVSRCERLDAEGFVFVTMLRAGLHYAQGLHARGLIGDSVEWLERLYALEGPRD